MMKHFHGLMTEAEKLVHLLEEMEEEQSVVEEDILSKIIKSLEEEINSCCCNERGSFEGYGNALSYLLMTSDDELGISSIPSLIKSPLYKHPPESPFHGDRLWHFEECNPNWVVPLEKEYAYKYYEERDYGGLFKLFKREQAVVPRR